MSQGLGRTLSVALTGLDGTLVDVEAHISQGLPHFAIGGMPDAACAQAPDRVRSAAANSLVPVPAHRVTVNLSPASIPKRGACFDLPIAVAVLSAAGVIRGGLARDVVHLGELALDGRVRGVHGILPAVLAAARSGARHVVVPVENVGEAQLVDGVTRARCDLPARRRRLVRRGRARHAAPAGSAAGGRCGRRPARAPTWPMSSASPRRGWPSSSRPRAGTTC